MTLEQIRNELDLIDKEIVRLLDQRATLGKQIGKIKHKLNLPLHHPERENQILQRLASLSDGSFPPQALKRIYKAVMAETLALQKNTPDPASHCPDRGRSGMKDIKGTITENVEIAPGFRRMRLLAPELGGVFRPGQFFQLRLGDEHSGFFLRRPFAPSECFDDGFSFVYAVVGEGTAHMAGMEPGSVVAVLAPLGNGYTLPKGEGTAVLFGGGCGAPSLHPLARELREAGVKVITVLGARGDGGLLECGLFGECGRLVTATDDGSAGCRGTVIDAFRREVGEDLIGDVWFYACGPVPMLRAVASLAEEEGVAWCEVSLEQRMACGFGACMGCAVPVRSGKDASVYRRVCHEGPVFASRELVWDEMGAK